MTGCRLNKAAALNAVERGVGRGMAQAMAALAQTSRVQAPVRGGGLTASCQAQTAGLAGAVGYGAAYAPIQHENRTLRHAGGKAGFLADPARDPAVWAAMTRALAEECRGELEG